MDVVGVSRPVFTHWEGEHGTVLLPTSHKAVADRIGRKGICGWLCMDLRIRRSLAMYVWLLEEEYDAPEMIHDEPCVM